MEGSNDEVGDGVAVEDLDAPEDIDLPGFKTLYPAQYRKVFAKWHGMTYYPTYCLTFLLI